MDIIEVVLVFLATHQQATLDNIDNSRYRNVNASLATSYPVVVLGDSLMTPERVNLFHTVIKKIMYISLHPVSHSFTALLLTMTGRR
jgi:hypothetical protein